MKLIRSQKTVPVGEKLIVMEFICSKKTGEKLPTLTIGQSISNGRINS
jgi:hypothetical protein